MADLAYLDASAIVKFAVDEPERAALENDAAGREGLVSSRLGAAEAFRAARRAGAESAISRIEAALEALYLYEVDAAVCRSAANVNPRQLRTSDAIHLATALAINDPELVFITYDTRLAKAAEANGLRVVQPGR